MYFDGNERTGRFVTNAAFTPAQGFSAPSARRAAAS